MEYFSEVYGCYYRIVRRILECADIAPVSRQEIMDITEQLGFAESVLTLPDKLCSGDWPLLEQTESKSFLSRLKHNPQMPLTLLQRRWIKSLLSDKRVSLFFDDAALAEVEETFSEVEPLWTEEQFYYYDRFENGDDFSSQEYRQSFRQIMDAIREKKVIRFDYTSTKGKYSRKTCLPLKIEYSPKNNRFRLIALRCPIDRHHVIDRYRLDGIKHVSTGRHSIEKSVAGNVSAQDTVKTDAATLPIELLMRQRYDAEPVRLLIQNHRNALERTMLHFANYDKDTRQLNENTWECLIYYDSSIETELLIEILSFGPVVKVTGPDAFVEQIRERLKKQFRLSLNPVLPPKPAPQP